MGQGYDRIKKGSDIDSYIQLKEPVPLTEEILIKAGFEFIQRGEEVYEQSWCINQKEIVWGPCANGAFCHDFLLGGEITDLHQLQNLFYCLSGKELEIEL
jgi:hypothetical protein